jgi:hypothetical protein
LILKLIQFLDMSSLQVIESSSNDFQQNCVSNVSIESSSADLTYVNIQFTIALAVPAGKFCLKTKYT